MHAPSTESRALYNWLDVHLRQLAARDQFAGVVGIFAGEQPLFHKSYGFANRSDFVPNDVTTRFSTASLTCMFTGVAIAQLVEQKLVSFKNPVRDYLPAAVAKRVPAKITVHQLLSHTSGLTDYFQDDLPGALSTTPADLASRFPIGMLRRPSDYLPLILNKPLRFEPGSTFSYCSAGYVLLGLIVEHVTGLPYFDCMRERVFVRAGMVDTNFFPLDAATPRRAVGYIPPAFQSNVYMLPPVGTPDSGACSTVLDLARFFAALQELRLLSESTARLLLQEHIVLDENQSYAYGFWLKRGKGSRQLLGHSGEEAGASARAYRLSEPGLTIVVLSNHSGAAGAVFDLTLEALLRKE